MLKALSETSQVFPQALHDESKILFQVKMMKAYL